MTTAKALGLPDMGWQLDAACHPDNRPPDVKAEWFWPLTYRAKGAPEDEPSVQAAFAVCDRCPVIEQCGRQAQLDPHARGVWARRYLTGQS